MNFSTRNGYIYTLLICLCTLFISGCKWFDGDGKAPDTTAPVITLSGANPQIIEIGVIYTELGASANDDEDGNVTANITIDSSAVDTGTLGSYSVTYDVSDAAGNAATTQTRIVDVVTDATPPVITLAGDNPQTIEVGNDYNELGASASDNMDGDISANIVIDDTAVDTNTVGSYSVTYNVSDAASNAATTQTRTVNVVDTTPPVISLTGTNPQNIDLDTTYTELGATASDNYDGDISANIVIDASAVNSSTVGSYSVTYNVSDTSGNDATQVTRTVNVGTSQATTFFTGNNGTSGYELFVTDGTADGTVLLKDVNPGTAHSFAEHYLKIDDVLFFVAVGSDGRELWKSDGTTDGTVMVKDIYPGALPSHPGLLTDVNGTLFFVARDNTNGIALWKSDGTTEGTVLVKDTDQISNTTGLNYLTNVNDTLYFQASDGGADGFALWKSDGTTDGTVMVKDTDPTGSTGPEYLINVNGTLFFRARDGINGLELWKSDGTADGTVMVKDIDPTSSSNPFNLYNANGTLYFQAGDGTNGNELWKSDGTADGTMMVKDINTSGSTSPRNFGSVNGTLYFQASDGSANGQELWKSDGTADGTMMVKDINPTGSSSPSNLVNLNGMLIFRATDGVNGYEIWKSDGTADGTVMIKDIDVNGNSWPYPLTWVNQNRPTFLPDGRLLFSADDGEHGDEPWITDGTEAGTTLVKDVNPGSGNGFYID